MVKPAPSTVAFAIHGPIARADLPGLCRRVCALLEKSRADVALCNVGGVDVDAVTVDALARLQLAAQRHGCRVRLRTASDELLELVAFMGLSDVLPDEEPLLRLEPSGQSEAREERVGVEEERELDDPPIRDLEDL
jgi:ABC-type transporter Mla MlaB component